MTTEKKMINTFRWGTWVLILAVSISAMAIIRYNDIKHTQEDIKRQIDFRFKSYDFIYFFANHKVVPDANHSAGYLCVDTSAKDYFYVMDRVKTPFYYAMDEVSCDLEHPNKSFIIQ